MKETSVNSATKGASWDMKKRPPMFRSFSARRAADGDSNRTRVEPSLGSKRIERMFPHCMKNDESAKSVGKRCTLISNNEGDDNEDVPNNEEATINGSVYSRGYSRGCCWWLFRLRESRNGEEWLELVFSAINGS